jgi:CheY-like chemotaxis protein/anti-sigma regulatory factor (Ser/Thr protein kinase)
VLHQTTTEISEVLDLALGRAARAIEDRNLQVFVRVPRTGLGVTCDPERIAQAFGNVLSNAVKYSSPQGRITIEAQRVDDRVQIVIRDEGAGIDADHLARILEPFRALVAEHSGLGLGLAIARELVELHSGTINVASAGVGRGTTVTIELPAVRSDTQVTPRQKTRRMRVLLVEDNHDTALALQHALETLGYEIALAHNGPVALTVARSFEPEVALLDINLPVMDGWELSRRLREVKVKGRNLPVIAVTARDQDQDKQRSAEAGFAGHLVKPIDLAELERVVEQLSAPRDPADQ